MINIQRLRILATLIGVTTLGACGGGGGGGSTDGGNKEPATRAESPFASAAMYVPTSQSNKSFTVANCTRFDDSAAVTSTTVALQANGDMVFSGSIGAASVTELARINFSETNSRNVYGNTEQAGVGFEVDYYKPDGSYMNLYSYNSSGGFRSSIASVRYDCETGPSTTTFSLEQPISPSRVITNLVMGSVGSMQVSPSGIVDHTQTGSIVSWDSGNTATFARFLSFNLETAQFGQGNSLNASSHTPIAFALPPLGNTVSGYYEEFLDTNSDKTIYFTYDNIDIRYRRYADPAANGGIGRQFRMYGTM